MGWRGRRGGGHPPNSALPHPPPVTIEGDRDTGRSGTRTEVSLPQRSRVAAAARLAEANSGTRTWSIMTRSWPVGWSAGTRGRGGAPRRGRSGKSAQKVQWTPQGIQGVHHRGGGRPPPDTPQQCYVHDGVEKSPSTKEGAYLQGFIPAFVGSLWRLILPQQWCAPVRGSPGQCHMTKFLVASSCAIS